MIKIIIRGKFFFKVHLLQPFLWEISKQNKYLEILSEYFFSKNVDFSLYKACFYKLYFFSQMHLEFCKSFLVKSCKHEHTLVGSTTCNCKKDYVFGVDLEDICTTNPIWQVLIEYQI